MRRVAVPFVLCAAVVVAGAQPGGGGAIEALDRDIRTGRYGYVDELLVMRGTRNRASPLLVERINDFYSGRQHARPTFIGRSVGTAALEFDRTSH